MLSKLMFAPLLLQGISAYCMGGPTSSQDSNLGAVHLMGQTETIDDRSDCPGVTFVQDLTRLVADLRPGSDYTLTYEVSTCGAEYYRSSMAWIDWNNNDIFEDMERLADGHLTQTGSETVKVNFQVPPDAALDASVRMRVMVQESSNPVLNPCAVFAYGGLKDFTITIGTGNICQPSKGCNVCEKCCFEYLDSSSSCNACVDQECNVNPCDPEGDCDAVCEECCKDYISADQCPQCVADRC